jgi:hypothetical protein
MIEFRLNVVNLNPLQEKPIALQGVILESLRFTYTPNRMSRLLQLCDKGLIFRHVITRHGVIEYDSR